MATSGFPWAVVIMMFLFATAVDASRTRGSAEQPAIVQDDDDDDAPQNVGLYAADGSGDDDPQVKFTYKIPSKSDSSKSDKAKLTYNIPAKSGKTTEQDDDSNDADDDSDDDDDAKDGKAATAASTAMDPAKQEKVNSLEKDTKSVEHQLDVNQAKQAEVQAQLLVMQNERSSEQEIEALVKKVANQTESKALASTLGKMWSEMRGFAQPYFAEHLQDQLAKLQTEERALSAKLDATRTNIQNVQKPKTTLRPATTPSPPKNGAMRIASTGCALLVSIIASTY